VVISNRLQRERAVRGRQVISSCAKVPARYWSKCVRLLIWMRPRGRGYDTHFFTKDTKPCLH